MLDAQYRTNLRAPYVLTRAAVELDAALVRERHAIVGRREMRLEGGEVTSGQIGVAVLERLRTIDEVTYLRFASVYKDFDVAADFHREIELLSKLGASPTG